MRGPGKGVMSATTQVKVSSPEIIILLWAKGSIFWKPVPVRAKQVSSQPACRGLSPWRTNGLYWNLGKPQRSKEIDMIQNVRGDWWTD